MILFYLFENYYSPPVRRNRFREPGSLWNQDGFTQTPHVAPPQPHGPFVSATSAVPNHAPHQSAIVVEVAAVIMLLR